MVRLEHPPVKATSLPPPRPLQRQRQWATLAGTLVGFTLLAVFVVSSVGGAREAELESEGVSLFKSAVESQDKDLQRHRAAEAKAKAQELKENGVVAVTGGKKQDMSDAALFKMAVKEQNTEIKKAEAKRAKLNAVAKKATGNNALPATKTEQLSDAKLFQDAIREQHADESKDKTALKRGLQDAIRKSEHAQMLSKAAQKAKVAAELREILGAAGESDKAIKGGKTAVQSPAQLSTYAKERKARQTQLAAVMRGIKGIKAPFEKKAVKPKKIVKPPPQMLSKSGEEQLYKLLVGGSGSPPSHAPAHTAAVALGALASKQAAGGGGGGGHTDVMMRAVTSADQHVAMTHTAQSYRQQETARADALEKSLLGGS